MADLYRVAHGLPVTSVAMAVLPVITFMSLTLPKHSLRALRLE